MFSNYLREHHWIITVPRLDLFFEELLVSREALYKTKSVSFGPSPIN